MSDNEYETRGDDPQHIGEIVGELRDMGMLPHDSDHMIRKFAQVTPEELELDPYTEEECNQSQMYFESLVRELQEDEPVDDRACFDAMHPNHTR